MDFDPEVQKPNEDKGKREEPLSEKDFIRNGWSFLSFPFWLWIFLLAVVVGVIWGTKEWYEEMIQKEKGHDPFLEVTNREFSVFLWQFPLFSRVNVSNKTGYLPGFYSTSENFNVGTAENFVSSPPELIFLYHTWSRLLSPDFISRPIPSDEFSEFLEQLPEWQPKNWKVAPNEYVQLIESKKYSKVENLQSLQESELPLIVRKVFQGWKNYFKEGPKINEIHPTFAQVETFLEKHPTYGRSYWRNIKEVENQQVAGEEYLVALLNGTVDPHATVPNNQLASFLKVALFNAEQAEQNK